MECERVMQRETFCVSPRATVQKAAMVMRQENIGFLPVCDEEGRVLGTLTDRDIALRVCADASDAGALIVADVMTREVVSCRPQDDLGHAEKLMAKHHKSRILVTDDKLCLLGLISVADVIVNDSNKHAAHTLRKIVEREYRY